MRNFAELISKLLFQPACLSVPLFVHFLFYTTYIKIDKFKIWQSQIWWVQVIYWTYPYKGPDNHTDWLIYNNCFNDISWSGAIYAMNFA